jgi:hypothetical protein
MKDFIKNFIECFKAFKAVSWILVIGSILFWAGGNPLSWFLAKFTTKDGETVYYNPNNKQFIK